MKFSADRLFNKILPKKFIVFCIATIGLFMHLIDGQSWTIIAGIYIGGNVAAKFIGGKNYGK